MWGLPATAILIAVNPIWGFSWFFNSESWATGVWDHWAAARTDTWREQMVLAIETLAGEKHPAGPAFPGPARKGSPARAISASWCSATPAKGRRPAKLARPVPVRRARPDVKFLMISSDVIYPSGAMSDYESKFYLPFKGFTKPIYAIPGNHDWYDALEAFAANFFEADAARACMHARVVTDGRVTTTTDSRIDACVRRRRFCAENSA